MNNVFHAPVEQIERFSIEVLTKLGVPQDDAEVCAKVLIASDLRGIESHGIGRLKMYFDRIREGIQFANTHIDVLSDRAACATWDGNHGMGHVIGTRAMQTAIDKARQYGLGSVAVRNSTHYGIAGYYASMAVNQGMIGISYTNARPSIAPTNSNFPMLGTNPICFGAPSDLPYPFLYDAATSITQRGKIEVLAREGLTTPEGWACDTEGHCETDTKRLLNELVTGEAALLPLGGIDETAGSHKGYGLATMVEILCAALQNGSYLMGLLGFKDGKKVPYSLGHFFLAINIEFFTDPADFRRITGDIMRQLQNAPRIPGRNRIYVAGEKEYENEIRVRREGVPIIPELQKDIEIMQNALSISEFDFSSMK
jgi:LDH2 family malate/lactate/ureidoglycolate dehydrogenase